MFNSDEWSELISKSYNIEKKILKLNDNNIIYFNSLTSHFGELVSLPAFGDFIEYNINNKELIDNFVKINKNKLISIKIFSKETKIPNQYFSSGFIHEISYSSSEDWLYNDIKSNFRSCINKAIKSNVNCIISSDKKDLKEFYRLHTNLRVNKFNQIPQPWSFFENLYKIFFLKKKGFVISAIYKTKIIASVLCLIDKDYAFYKYAASDLDFTYLRPNNFLIYKLIEYLDNIGINKLNMGYTGSSEEYNGLRKFKIKAGCKEYSRYTINNYQDDNNFKNFKVNIQNEINKAIKNEKNDKTIQKLGNQFYKYFL